MNLELLIVGLDNPQSRDPRFALYPMPRGCSGARLLEMLQEVCPEFTMHRYLSIPKTNLFPVGPAAKGEKALREVGYHFVVQLSEQGRRVILCGSPVRDAVFRGFSKEPPDMMKWTTLAGSSYAWIPHPSGRNHFYNDHDNKIKVGKFLLKEARRAFPHWKRQGRSRSGSIRDPRVDRNGGV